MLQLKSSSIYVPKIFLDFKFFYFWNNKKKEILGYFAAYVRLWAGHTITEHRQVT